MVQKPLSDISGARAGLQSALMKLWKGIEIIDSIAQKDLVSVHKGRVDTVKAVLAEGVTNIFADDLKAFNMSLRHSMKELMSKPAADIIASDLKTWNDSLVKLQDSLPTASDLGRSFNV